jgi:predicted esterase
MSANAETYNIDPNHIAVGGGSAGAFTAIAVGVSEPGDYLDELTDAQDETRASTNPTASSKVRAILDFWGGPSIPLVAEELDSRSRFDATDPAISIIHGTVDETVSYDQATALVALYTKTGAPYELYPLEGKGHGPWGARYEGKTLAELSFTFLVNQQGLIVE